MREEVTAKRGGRIALGPDVRSMILEAGDKGARFTLRGVETALGPGERASYAKLNAADETIEVEAGRLTATLRRRDR